MGRPTSHLRFGLDGQIVMRRSAMALALSAALVGCAQAPDKSASARQLLQIEPVYRVQDSGTRPVASVARASQSAQDDRWTHVPRATDTSVSTRLAELAAAGDASSLHEVGLSLARSGRLEQAAAAMRLAQLKSPKDPRVLNNLGHVLYLQGQPEQARELFIQALTIEPGYDYARGNLAKLDIEHVAPADAVASPPLPPALLATQDQVGRHDEPVNAEEAGDAVSVDAASPIVPEGAKLIPVATDLSHVSVVLVNGNGLDGACATTRAWLRGKGLEQVRMVNAKRYDRKSSSLHFHPGQLDKAQALARALPMQVRLVAVDAAPANGALWLVLGQDLRQSPGLQELAALPEAHAAVKAQAMRTAAAVRNSRDIHGDRILAAQVR
jgi:tetratricopeptide (TPR) repeat protein